MKTKNKKHNKSANTTKEAKAICVSQVQLLAQHLPHGESELSHSL
jgi:hypothetical protein